jgi:chromate reductase, NAD(P)H dehydrogenase (quinone)
MNTEKVVRILAISGSLRRASFCTGLIQTLATSSGLQMEIKLHDIGDIPLFNEDLEEPAGVSRLNRAVAESDGVLIVTPEYNHGVPGVLKNALDWASQPFQKSVFRHKPVSVISTSLAFTGGVRAQHQLRETLHSMLAIVVPGPEVVLGGIHTKFANDALVDEKVLLYILRALKLLRNEILAAEVREHLEAALQ